MKIRLKLEVHTDVTNEGYGPIPHQVGRRIEWDRFIALEQWVKVDDEAIEATLKMRTIPCE